MEELRNAMANNLLGLSPDEVRARLWLHPGQGLLPNESRMPILDVDAAIAFNFIDTGIYDIYQTCDN